MRYLSVLCVSLSWSAFAGPPASGAPPLTDLKGAPIALAAYGGRIVLLNFWATWCAPCRQEMPELNRLYGQLDPQQTTIIGIAADDRPAVAAFVARLGIRYPIAVGDADQVFAWTAKLGNISEGLPFTVLLDGSGKVRWTQSGGQLSSTEVQRQIHHLLVAIKH